MPLPDQNQFASDVSHLAIDTVRYMRDMVELRHLHITHFHAALCLMIEGNVEALEDEETKVLFAISLLGVIAKIKMPEKQTQAKG